MKTDIKPAGYHVLLAVEVVEEKTAGGIVLMEHTRNREQAAVSVGKVLAFGPMAFKGTVAGVKSPEDWGVKVGDRVKFPKHVGMKLSESDEGEQLVLVVDHEIKAIVV